MDLLDFELKALDDGDEKTAGTFEGVMSVPVLDRDNEIIDSKAFDPLPEHITIDIDHGLTVEKTVGSGKPYYDVDGHLKVKGTFASTPLGQQVRTLVKEGHIRHMSVVFRNPVREKDAATGLQHVRKGELVNCTITGIPANTSTSINAKAGARNSAKDLERIQNTHDHMVELGAKCTEKCAHGFETGGPVKAGSSYVVGERGPELLSMGTTGGNIVPSNTKEPITLNIDGRKFMSWLVDESRDMGGVPLTTRKNADTEAPADTTAAPAAVVAGAEVEVARALAELALTEAALALD